MCRMSLTSGVMLWVNFWLLFFPLPHCGFLTTLLGLPFKRMIRYHRWVPTPCAAAPCASLKHRAVGCLSNPAPQ